MLPSPHCGCSGVDYPRETSSADPPCPFALKRVFTRVTGRDALFDKNQGTSVSGPTAGTLAFATRCLDRAVHAQLTETDENPGNEAIPRLEGGDPPPVLPGARRAEARGSSQTFCALAVTPKSAAIMLRSYTVIFGHLADYLRRSLHNQSSGADCEVVASTILEALSRVYSHTELRDAFLDGFGLALPDMQAVSPALNDRITRLVNQVVERSRKIAAQEPASESVNSFSQVVDLARDVAASPQASAVLIDALSRPEFRSALKLDERLIYDIARDAESVKDSASFASFVQCFRGALVSVSNTGGARAMDLSEFLGNFSAHPSAKGFHTKNQSAVLFVTLAFAAQGDSFSGVNLRLMLNSGAKPNQHRGYGAVGVNDRDGIDKQGTAARVSVRPVKVITPLLTQSLCTDVGDEALLGQAVVTVDCLHSSCRPDVVDPARWKAEKLYDWLLDYAVYTDDACPASKLAHLSGHNIPLKMTQDSSGTGPDEYVRSTVRVGTVYVDDAPDQPLAVDMQPNRRLLDTEYLLMGLACELSLYIKQKYSLASLPTLDIAMLSAYAPCLSCNRGMLMALFDNEKFPNLNKLSYWACEQLIPKQIFPPETGFAARPESSRAALTQPD